MVLRERERKMASDQPVKKKIRRTDEDHAADETDFISNGVHADLSALHLALPPNVNEADIMLNTINTQYSTSKHNKSNDDSSSVSSSKSVLDGASISSVSYIMQSDTSAIEPAPNIFNYSFNNMQSFVDTLPLAVEENTNNQIDRDYIKPIHTGNQMFVSAETIKKDNQSNKIEEEYQIKLIQQCLCGLSEVALRRPFEREASKTNENNTLLCEWPVEKILHFLSNLQLLFDVYLKQNNKGYICARIVDICDSIVRNEYNIIEQITALPNLENKYVNFVAAKVIASFLIIAKTNINNEWLETIINFLTLENINYDKTNFALEIIKRVVEWKDMDIHILEESQLLQDNGATTSQEVGCVTIPFSDPDSYDTSAIKGLIIKGLESKWPELTSKMQTLIANNNTIQSNTCVLTFLALWESIISVKANLSVIDTKPFYAQLEAFVCLLRSSLSPIIWKQLLSLFNEVLCYGSTLALQDMLPDDTCQLAHLIVRYVKDFRLLDHLPFRRDDGLTVHSFVGAITNTYLPQTTIDKTLLQKMVLLVLKSVAITIKETRSDSSDSSVGSDDFDFYQDMQLIERSIRDVIKKVDTFIKNNLDFHPETPFSKILIHLFSDQDDYMIETMVCTLDITVGISYRNAVFPDLLAMLNPTHSFIEFLKVVSHDPEVLLDYLVSNETCFLLYLLRFLKYTRRNWTKFVSSCSESSGITRVNELDNTMTVIIRLKIQINRLVSKELFPYNISPVLRLLEMCEGLYEGNEYS